MPLLEAIAIKLSVDTIKWLASQGIDYLTKSDYNDYEKELIDIITNTTETYKQKYGAISKSGKLHFCNSQTIISELLRFRFSKNPNPDELNKAIQNDVRLETPTEDELGHFLEIFSANIKNSVKLAGLNIENNYKEEIFSISAKLNSVADFITELKKDAPNELIEEWSNRLDEVTSNIEKFKPKTAFDILERLEARISEKGIQVNSVLRGKIIYLKAVCRNELLVGDIDVKAAELFVNAYKCSPDNIEFKANAGLAYLVLDENDKAEKLANEILEIDEYHTGGWSIKCFLKGKDFRPFLNEVPAHVKNKREFKAQVGYWIVNKRLVRTILELDKLGFNFEITDKNEPISITSMNKWYWTVVLTYLTNKLYELYPLLNSSGFDSTISENVYFSYIHSILKKLAAAIDGTEVEENYAWYKFQLYYMDYSLSQDKRLIHLLETTFDKIKIKLPLEVIQMVQVYNSFGTVDQITKAIKVINEFGEEKNEILCLFNSYNHLQTNNPNESIKSFNKYLNLHESIEERVFFNIIHYLNALGLQNADAVNGILTLANTKVFYPPALKDLIGILTTPTDEPLQTDETLLKEIKTEVDDNNKTLRYYVGLAYYRNRKYNEVVEYLSQKVNKAIASDELKLYCLALFVGDGDKLELLSILENWRKTQPLDYNLIRAELHIREVQKHWDIFVVIAKQALVAFPGDESLIYALFLGFDNQSDSEGIKNSINLINFKDFKDELFGIAISGILLKAGLADEAIELLYEIALKKSNIRARSSYLGSLVSYPEELFKDFTSVEIGTYVEYDCDGKNEILFFDDEHSKTALGKALFNKTVGETAIVGNTRFSGKQIMVKVIRVMNKYAALLRELFIDAENPLSGYPVEVIKFDSSNAEDIQKKMIENFGAVGSVQKEFREKEFEKYYNGKSSFTEIAISNFDKNRFEAYFYLISPNGKRFKAISPIISNKQLLNDDSKFVLDVTSVCLFFQLSKEIGLTFNHKFIISASLRSELVTMITETRINPEAKLSVNITTDGVVPHIYQEGFKEGRLAFLSEILQWMDNNCEIDHVDEKLNLVLNLDVKSSNIDDFIYSNLDNRLLVDRPNHFLLTNDIFYYIHLQASKNNVISPELYLEKFQGENFRDYSSFMLKCNYVGITIYLEVLQDEFVKMMTGKENKYPVCLDNFEYPWNPNLEHARVIARFLKWLYISSPIIRERKNRTALTLFLSALRGAHPIFGQTLMGELEKEFLLLGDWFHQIQKVLLDAMRIINATR